MDDEGFLLTFGLPCSLTPDADALPATSAKAKSDHSHLSKGAFAQQEIWHELWSDTLRLETTFKHKGQVKTVMMTNTHWGAFSTFADPFKVQGGCSVLSPDIWPPYSWGVHAPFCTINQNGTAKNSKPQEKKMCFHVALQHNVAYLPRQQAGNCYQLPARVPRSLQYAWWTKLLFLCQIPHTGFKIFNDSINIYVKRWGAAMRASSSCGLRYVVCRTAKVRKKKKKNEPGTRIFSNSLPEFPVSANVGEECLRRAGRESEPRDYQFRVQSAYRSWICRHHPDWSFKHIHCCGKTDFVFSSNITQRCPSVMLNFSFNSQKKKKKKMGLKVDVRWWWRGQYHPNE